MTTATKLYNSALEMLPEIMELEDQLKQEHYIGLLWDQCQHMAQGYQTWPAKIVDGLESAETMVFEGAQGVLLDEKYGTAPHNTWTKSAARTR
jgi:adenylosuccinate synthase